MSKHPSTAIASANRLPGTEHTTGEAEPEGELARAGIAAVCITSDIFEIFDQLLKQCEFLFEMCEQIETDRDRLRFS